MNVPPAKSLCLGESAHRWPAEQLSQAHSWRNTGQLGLSSIWQRTRRKIRKLKMNSYPLLFFTRDRNAAPSSFPLSASQQLPSPLQLTHFAACSAHSSLWNKVRHSRTGLVLDPKEGHSHFTGSTQTPNIHWVLLCVHYSSPQGDIQRLNNKNNCISLQIAHCSEQSD